MSDNQQADQSSQVSASPAEPAVSVSTPTQDQPVSADPDISSDNVNRPEPTVSADPSQNSADSSPTQANISADSNQMPLSTEEPSSTISAQSPQVSADSTTSSADSSNLANPTSPTDKPVVSADSTQPPPSPTNPPEPAVLEKPVEVIKEVVKEVPVIDQIKVNEKSEEKIRTRLSVLRDEGNRRKKERRQAFLQKIVDVVRSQGQINNQQAQKKFHLPQSTLTDYFQELVSQGILRKEGKGKATFYHL
ncbi:MAG: hypothetical protein ACOY0S_01265 [Patescibacteria group bacterium]